MDTTENTPIHVVFQSGYDDGCLTSIRLIGAYTDLGDVTQLLKSAISAEVATVPLNQHSAQLSAGLIHYTAYVMFDGTIYRLGKSEPGKETRINRNQGLIAQVWADDENTAIFQARQLAKKLQSCGRWQTRNRPPFVDVEQESQLNFYTNIDPDREYICQCGTQLSQSELYKHWQLGHYDENYDAEVESK